MVLIKPALAAQLGLTPIPLSQPEHVNVAISPANTANTFTHYVDLEPSMQNQKFCSNPVHAVLANKLSVPLILGMPFLVTNCIMCNYANRECNVLLHGTPQPNIKRVDALATLIGKTQQPELELTHHENTAQEKFSRVFEQLPHTDELPTEPVARIQLKNPDIVVKTRNYACPRKWKEAWHTPLQQHLAAGRIRPSDG
jgi:hypothetical protein